MSKEKTKNQSTDQGKLVFSLERIIIPVVIADEQGNDEEYTLHEATGAAASLYRDQMLKGSIISKGGDTSIGRVADAELFLLSLCLKNSKNALVKLVTLKSYPNRVTSVLCEKLKEISGLSDDDDEDVDAIKNSTTEKKAGSE